jgi:tetratricopeptide (TPR) repeat protein
MLEADNIGMSNPRKDPQMYRYSEAPFWEWQRNYYEDKGMTAWQNDEIPQFITSNPMIAVAYAEMIFGLLQDRARLGLTSEAVTIIELGAGSGRLAFHVLKELSELMVFAGTTLPTYRYIMTDLAEDNIAYWRQHSGLTPFVEQGLLDFARFDAVRDIEVNLTLSGQTIRTGDLQQPLVVVANYFFDSIPQELIYVEDGNLFECLVSLQLPDESDNYSTTEKLDNVELEYHYQRADNEQMTSPFNHVVELYRQKLDDAHILIPAIGIRCLERLSVLSQQGFMLLTADKGVHRLEHWEFAEPPKLIVHSSFSITVNYHAMKSFYEQKGAQVYFTAHHHNNLNIGCVLMLSEPNSFVNTRLAYRRFVERFGPDDYFSIKQWLDGQLDQLGVQQILALWRLGGYDAEWLIQSAKRISMVLPDITEDELEDIRHGIHTMWSKYYAVVNNQRIARNCGMLLFQMECYEDAIPYLKQALEHHITDAAAMKETSIEVLYHLAISCYEVGRDEEALLYTARTLVNEPEHEGALALKVLLEELEAN